MKSYKNIFIFILIIAALLYFFLGNLSEETKRIIIAIAFLIFLFYLTDKRFRKIENVLGLLQDPTKKEEMSKPLSYKIRIYENIEWFEIIKHCFPDLKTTKEVRNFVHNLFEDPNLIESDEKEEGLFQKDFSFVEFSDGLSGLYQYWSDYHKTFVDEVEVRGYLLGGFRSCDRLLIKYGKENKIWRGFVVRPEFIGFESDLPDGDLMEEDKISQIPLGDIIDFFIKVHKNMDSHPMHGVKTFSKKLQDAFDKHGIKYEVVFETWMSRDFSDIKLIESKWATDNNIEIWHRIVKYHVFKTPYYSLRIAIDVFD